MSARHTREMLTRAALAALGILEDAERAEFETHVATGCAECAKALESFEEVAGNLGYLAERAPARAELREAVLGRIAAEAALASESTIHAAGVFFARTGSLDWQRTPLPGFDSKVLYYDEGRKILSQLVRLVAGAEVPAHRHTDVEELFVLEGDLIVNDVLMRAGDYCRAEADSLHRVSRSPNGCVFVVVSSAQDRPLDLG